MPGFVIGAQAYDIRANPGSIAFIAELVFKLSIDHCLQSHFSEGQSSRPRPLVNIRPTVYLRRHSLPADSGVKSVGGDESAKLGQQVLGERLDTATLLTVSRADQQYADQFNFDGGDHFNKVSSRTLLGMVRKKMEALNKALSDAANPVDVLQDYFGVDSLLSYVAGGDDQPVADIQLHLQSIADSLKEYLNCCLECEKPEPPFTGATLREAALGLGLTEESFLKAANELHCGVSLGDGTRRLITSIETDSIKMLSREVSKVRKYIKITKRLGSHCLLQNFVDSIGSKDDNEAIRPIDLFLVPEKVEQHLTKDQSKLYKLIWQRIVASQMNTAQAVKARLIGDETWTKKNEEARLLRAAISGAMEIKSRSWIEGANAAVDLSSVLDASDVGERVKIQVPVCVNFAKNSRKLQPRVKNQVAPASDDYSQEMHASANTIARAYKRHRLNKIAFHSRHVEFNRRKVARYFASLPSFKQDVILNSIQNRVEERQRHHKGNDNEVFERILDYITEEDGDAFVNWGSDTLSVVAYRLNMHANETGKGCASMSAALWPSEQKSHRLLAQIFGEVSLSDLKKLGQVSREGVDSPQHFNTQHFNSHDKSTIQWTEDQWSDYFSGAKPAVAESTRESREFETTEDLIYPTVYNRGGAGKGECKGEGIGEVRSGTVYSKPPFVRMDRKVSAFAKPKKPKALNTIDESEKAKTKSLRSAFSNWMVWAAAARSCRIVSADLVEGTLKTDRYTWAGDISNLAQVSLGDDVRAPSVEVEFASSPLGFLRILSLNSLNSNDYSGRRSAAPLYFDGGRVTPPPRPRSARAVQSTISFFAGTQHLRRESPVLSPAESAAYVYPGDHRRSPAIVVGS